MLVPFMESAPMIDGFTTDEVTEDDVSGFSFRGNRSMATLSMTTGTRNIR